MTRDIDLVVELEPRDGDRIITLFENDYYVPRNALIRAIDNRSVFNLIHHKSIVKVDFIVRKDNDYRRLAFGRRRQVAVYGIQVCIVSKESLVISKLYWARDSHSEFQLRDVRNLQIGRAHV